MRPAHILKPNKAKQFPKWVVFYDTETNEVPISETKKRLVLKFGYAILTRRNRSGSLYIVNEKLFYDPVEFNDWLLEQGRDKETINVVAHNIAFDVRVTGTLSYLSAKRYTRTLFIEEGINFIVKYRKGSRSYRFTNNQQLFNMSLSKLGQSLNYEKSHMPEVSAPESEWIEYCKRDVMVMLTAWNAWFAFVRENDLGNFQITAASQAMSSFRHRFMPTEVFIHNSKPAIALERESYHGGRVECFFIGEHTGAPIYNVDVNSMYPYVMKTVKVPTKLLRHYKNISLEVFRGLHKNYGYIVEADVVIKEAKLPCTNGGFLHFPVGAFRGVFTKAEFEELMTLGEVKAVHRCNIYREELLFADYVDFFYKARHKWKKEGNSAFAFLAKLMLNGLYGKFGQKQLVYKQIGSTNEIPDGVYTVKDAGGKVPTKLRVIDGIVEQSVGYEEGYNAFPAISSVITSAARNYLLTFVRRAGWDHVLYTDTDSLFVDGDGFKRLSGDMSMEDIGKLKLEGVSDTFNVVAPKWYEFGDKKVLKGIRANAVAVGERTFEQDKFLSFRGSLRKHDLNGVIIERVRKTLNPKYRKGIVTASGRVKPLELS